MAKHPGGRPRKKVDMALLEKLAKLHLSDEVIANCLGISIDTLHRRFADQVDDFKSMSKAKLADVLFDEGVNKREPYAVKMLSQKHLGYADKVETRNENKDVVVDLSWSDEVEDNNATKDSSTDKSGSK